MRTRHRDHFTATVAALEALGHAHDEQLLAWAQTETDNLRGAFTWSRENSDLDLALQLILSLRPLWLRGGRAQEALNGLAAVLADRGALADSTGGVGRRGGVSEHPLWIYGYLDGPGSGARGADRCSPAR